MPPFIPVNAFEEALASANAGTLSPQVFLGIFLSSDVVLPSATELQPDGSGMQPLFFEKDGVGMLSLFSDLSRVESFASKAPYALVLKGLEMLKRLPKEYGIVLNPGQTVGLELHPDGIRQLLSELQ